MIRCYISFREGNGHIFSTLPPFLFHEPTPKKTSLKQVHSENIWNHGAGTQQDSWSSMIKAFEAKGRGTPTGKRRSQSSLKLGGNPAGCHLGFLCLFLVQKNLLPRGCVAFGGVAFGPWKILMNICPEKNVSRNDGSPGFGEVPWMRIAEGVVSFWKPTGRSKTTKNCLDGSDFSAFEAFDI